MGTLEENIPFFIASGTIGAFALVSFGYLLALALSAPFRRWMLDEKGGLRPLIIFGTAYLILELAPLLHTVLALIEASDPQSGDYPGSDFLDAVQHSGFSPAYTHARLFLALALFSYGLGLTRRAAGPVDDE